MVDSAVPTSGIVTEPSGEFQGSTQTSRKAERGGTLMDGGDRRQRPTLENARQHKPVPLLPGVDKRGEDPLIVKEQLDDSWLLPDDIRPRGALEGGVSLLIHKYLTGILTQPELSDHSDAGESTMPPAPPEYMGPGSAEGRTRHRRDTCVEKPVCDVCSCSGPGDSASPYDVSCDAAIPCSMSGVTVKNDL